MFLGDWGSKSIVIISEIPCERMAFFRNYSSQTVSQSVPNYEGQGQRIKTMVGNEDKHMTLSEREFDKNADVQYESEGEDAGRMQGYAAPDNGVSVSSSHMEPSGRKNPVGNWGSTFWKDCQPVDAQGAYDSGQDSKSEYRNVEGSEDISDRRDDKLESGEDEEELKDADKVQKAHSDVPADEMLSDEYYEQDGEDQSDSMHYRRLSHSTGLNDRSHSKPAPGNKNASRISRALCNNENDDDIYADGDYEEEDEEDGNYIVIAVFCMRSSNDLYMSCHYW